MSRAHRAQAAREVDHLGLARRVLEHGAALGQRCRHHQVLGAGHGHDVESRSARREAASRAPRCSRARARSRRPSPAGPSRAGRPDEGRSRSRRAARRAPRRSARRAGRAPGSTRASSSPARRAQAASRCGRPRASRCRRAPSCATPICFSSVRIVRTSLSCGTLVRRSGSGVSSAAQRIGSAAFFAPETAIAPASRAPPSMTSLSIALAGWRAAPPRRAPSVSAANVSMPAMLRRDAAARDPAQPRGRFGQSAGERRRHCCACRAAHSAGVSVLIDSAWISSRMRSPSAA